MGKINSFFLATWTNTLKGPVCTDLGGFRGRIYCILLYSINSIDYTVEVGRLHRLKLKVLKLIF